MNVHEVGPSASADVYMDLFARSRGSQSPPTGMGSTARGLVRADYSYLRNNFHQRMFVLEEDGTVKLAAIAFVSKCPSIPNSLGGFLALEACSQAELNLFLERVSGLLTWDDFLLPLNGHADFGVSTPFPATPAGNITFLTSSRVRVLDHLFSCPNVRLERTYIALTTQLDRQKAETLKHEIASPPAGFSTRPIARLRFRSEIRLYNELSNSCMEHVPLMLPMADRERWELMRASLPVVTPDTFRFLCHNGEEIGFCFSLLDYNQVMRGPSDLHNALSIMTRRRKISRARILSSGILPQYRGQGLFKYVRNRVLLALAERGISTVESSYVDLENTESIRNVRSRGAKETHRFGVFRSTPGLRAHPRL